MVFIESDKRAKRTKAYFKECFPESIVVVPTLGQLEETEKPNAPDYVKSVEHTRLAARNFRNIWRQKTHGDFQEFAALVEGNWKGIELQKPTIVVGMPSTLEMIYVENDYPREIYLSGFGFQAWMQIMTHFLRGSGGDILVLDEPDVYLHADLQRRLYSIAKRRFSQIFLATHSAEIMNEANSGDVVLVRTEFQTGKRITTEEGYRSAHALLGSSENADFARLSRAKRIIAFEGNDRSIYRRFEQMLISDGVFSDPDTMLLKIGGYEQWPRVSNLPWAFQELFGIQPKIAAIFDRDYRCLEEIEGHEQKLRKSGVFCRVLRRKEIENYVIAPDALFKAAQKAAKKKQKVVEVDWLNQLLSSISLELREDCLINVQSSTSKYYQLKRDGRDTQTVLKLAKNEFDKDWMIHGFSYRISGKEFFSAFNRALDETFGVSISLFQVLDELHVQELDAEFCEMIAEVNRYFSEE